MSELDLQGIRARAEGASNGPWAWDNRGDKENDVQVGIALDEDDEPISGFFDTEDVIYVEGVARITSSNPCGDADFIAHARADIPALCDEVERLRQERDRLRVLLAVSAVRLYYQEALPVFGLDAAELTELLNTEAEAGAKLVKESKRD